MNIHREIRYYSSIINNDIYFIKIEIFCYSENTTHNLEISNLNLTNNPTYILETNNNYYDFYVPTLPNNIPREIEEEQVIALYLRNDIEYSRNNRYDRYDRYTL